jgi:predicted metal-dependent enzyme (double-stranded beta helix superfamily)
MTTSSETPQSLLEFCKTCATGLSGLTDDDARIQFVSGLLPQLISDKPLFRGILEGMVTDAPYLELRYATMFDSEVILYRDPSNLFSVRLFLWEPGIFDPVHDHNAWGVIGPVAGELEIVNFRRTDDGLREGYAHLLETDRKTILPGENYHVRGSETIHKTGNPGSRITVQVSIYGRPQAKKDQINGFDIIHHRIFPIYAPKTRKQRLARQALSDSDLHFS